MNKLFLLFSVLVFSCAHNPQEKFLMGNLYYQKSPEVKALYHQAYNVASSYLIKKIARKKKQCIVMDIDETVLDNSSYQGWLYDNKTNYKSKSWEEWVALADARALPGALDFIHLARKKNIRVLFVTNRKQHLMAATIENMKKLGVEVPNRDIIGRTVTSSKEERRNTMAKNCKISMLVGDSLADFGVMFEGDHKTRVAAVKKYAKDWGSKFIIVPNPMYGDWVKGAGSQKLRSFR